MSLAGWFEDVGSDSDITFLVANAFPVKVESYRSVNSKNQQDPLQKTKRIQKQK